MFVLTTDCKLLYLLSQFLLHYHYFSLFFLLLTSTFRCHIIFCSYINKEEDGYKLCPEDCVRAEKAHKKMKIVVV